MQLVPRRTRVSHTSFKKLPIGAAYYLSATSGPFHKMGQNLKLTAGTDPQTTPTLTAIPDVSVDVIRVDRFFRREQS